MRATDRRARAGWGPSRFDSTPRLRNTNDSCEGNLSATESPGRLATYRRVWVYLKPSGGNHPPGGSCSDAGPSSAAPLLAPPGNRNDSARHRGLTMISKQPQSHGKRKNPAAVALGRLGGKKAAGRGAKLRFAKNDRRRAPRRATALAKKTRP